MPLGVYSEVGTLRKVAGLVWQTADPTTMLLPPLPNFLFQRDCSCWIFGGVTINPMTKSLLIKDFMPLLPALADRLACGRRPSGAWAAVGSRSRRAAWS